MPRSANAKNIFYNYKLTVDGKEQYLRTCKCMATELNISLSTIRQKLLNPDLVFRKHPNKVITITKVKVPIYQKMIITY
jgi:rhamnose utilization protein RhaD (predicted bifunctional aldolase and dehydrogenase)